MLIVVTVPAAWDASGNPLHYAMLRAGYMARWILNQMVNHMPGIEIGVISNRTVPKDAASVSLAEPVVDVVAVAKIELAAGTVLDRFGGFLTHGFCENAATVQTARLLPMSIAEGARLRRTVAKERAEPRRCRSAASKLRLPAARRTEHSPRLR
jgi:predicted homoserine dehydrogenase-like protein